MHKCVFFMFFGVPSACSFSFNNTFNQLWAGHNHCLFLHHVEIVQIGKNLTLVAAIWQRVCSRDTSDRDLTVIGLSSGSHDFISLRLSKPTPNSLKSWKPYTARAPPAPLRLRCVRTLRSRPGAQLVRDSLALAACCLSSGTLCSLELLSRTEGSRVNDLIIKCNIHKLA